MKCLRFWSFITGIVIFAGTCKVTVGAPPVISNLPIIRYIGEQTTDTELLYILEVSDPNGDRFTCESTITANNGTATGNEFDLRLNSGRYEMYATPSSTCCTYNFNLISSFANTVTCTDSNNETSTALVLTAEIVDNERVTINNVVNNPLTPNALTTGQNADLTTVSTTSLLGSLITYNMTCTPTFDPSFFYIVSGTGEIKTNRELKYLDSGTPTSFCTVTAIDNVNNIEIFETQLVNPQSQNTIPTASNLPASASVLESFGTASSLITVSVSDPDSSSTACPHSYVYRFVVDPATATDTFTINSATGEFRIASGQTLDFESIPFYNITFYIHDGCHESAGLNYQLTVIDDNETPVFSNTMYFGSTVENTMGNGAFDPGLTCTDVDNGQTLTYDFTAANNSERFGINSSGIIYFDTNYDVDGSAMPAEVILTVLCIDSGGTDGNKLTGTAQITITVSDANDNTPTFPSSTYQITIDTSTASGTVIGTLTASDADSTSNAALICASSPTGGTFDYITIGTDCEIVVSDTATLTAGNVFSYTVSAIDSGSPRLTGTTAVDIIVQAATTTTTTTAATTTEYNFFSRGENIFLFILALLAGLALLGLLTWCLLRFCCGGGRCGNACDCDCMSRSRRSKRPIRQVTPQTPPNRKFRPPSPKTPPPPPRVGRTGVFTVAGPVYTAMRPTARIIRAPPTVRGFYG